MSPGKLSLLLGMIPPAVLVGLSLGEPLSGVAFYLSFVALSCRYVDVVVTDPLRFFRYSLLSLIPAVFLKLLVTF